MKKVFVANKNSYGAEFFDECNTLDELKRAIVAHELRHAKYVPEYTEELFEEHSSDYALFEVDLHNDEHIVWREYDGTSWFKVEKKVVKLLSQVKQIRSQNKSF